MAPFGQYVLFYYCFITKGNWKLQELTGHSLCVSLIVSLRGRITKSKLTREHVEFNIYFSAMLTVSA